MRPLPAARPFLALLAGACSAAALAAVAPASGVLEVRAADAAAQTASSHPRPTPKPTARTTIAPPQATATAAPTPTATAATAAPTPASHAHTILTPLAPSIPPMTVPTFMVVPVGTLTPLPRIVSPGGVIAPYSPFPSPPASPEALPASTPGPLSLPTARPAATVASTGPPPPAGGAGPTAFLGLALAAGFIAVTELYDRRRPA
jgi:hypothetical protein